jgi:hypothetical protein
VGANVVYPLEYGGRQCALDQKERRNTASSRRASTMTRNGKASLKERITRHAPGAVATTALLTLDEGDLFT